jgi:hypothetical protein
MAGKSETYETVQRWYLSYTKTVHPSKQVSEIIEIINIGYYSKQEEQRNISSNTKHMC